jgi:outer membrane protein|tara:strand:+ start:1202 stop:2464 length:1263 start_codon:yes stop_codon:yes gene_type:complete
LASSHRLAAFILTATTAIGSHASQFQELFQFAQANDPNYLSAQHTLDSKLQIIPQAKSALMPQVSGTFNQNLALDAGSNKHNYNVQVALPLRLDAYYGMKVAEQSAAGARINFEKTHQSLIFSVIERYIAVIKQQHQLSSSMAEVTAIEQRLKQTQKQVELGISSNIQLQDVQANFQQLQVALLQVRQNLSLARADLENLTNQALPEQLPALASSFNAASFVQTDSLENWFVLAQNNNLDLASNGFASQQAYHNYQAKEVGTYPQATLTMSQSYTTTTGDSKKLTIGLSGTFYDGGLNTAQTREAKEAWHASQQQGQALLRATQQEVRRWHQALDTSRQQIQALAQLRTAVQASLAGKNKEYELGLRDISDILDAEKLVFSAQRNLANARLDLVLNQLRLKQTSGLLNTNDLSQLDQWFN